MNALRKVAVAALVALTVASGLTLSSAPAEARNGRNAALIGGLAAGAVLGGLIVGNQVRAAPSYGYDTGYNYNSGYGYNGGYGYAPAYAPTYRQTYVAPRPVYVENAQVYVNDYYAPRCRIVRERVVNEWGDTIARRRVRVCD